MAKILQYLYSMQQSYIRFTLSVCPPVCDPLCTLFNAYSSG